MKLNLIVLIAAVTVNCLVTAINVESASTILPVPYIDMLLPPFADKADSTEVAEKTVTTQKNIEAVSTLNTTIKPITNDAHNTLPELSIEALLPPLFEAKIEQEETEETTANKTATTTTTPATTRRPTTIKTTTLKPTTTTTLQPIKAVVPELLLDPLLPPLLDNEIVAKDITITTTEKSLTKTTKKSYYQQQQQYTKNLPANTKNDLKKLNVSKSSQALEKHAAETKTQAKQVSLNEEKLLSNIKSLAKQHVAKQVAAQQKHVPNTHSNYKHNKEYNYSFDLYFGSTTPRPAKSGLPTITPFPHRLGKKK